MAIWNNQGHKGYFLITLLLILIGGISCYKQNATPTKKTRPRFQEIKVNLGTEPPSLDPRQATDVKSNLVLAMLFDGLTRVNPNGAIVASAAYKIEQSSDLKTYTFHLRDSYWSNGVPVTAYDFEYSWKSSLDPKNGFECAYKLFIIKNGRAAAEGKVSIDQVGVRALNEKTLQVELETPAPYFLQMTATRSYYPIHKQTDLNNPRWSQNASTDYVCNGPFLLNEWAHNSNLQVVRNPYYWDVESVKLEKIDVYMINDSTTQLGMFEQAELDWCGLPFQTLPTDALNSLRKDNLLRVNPTATSSMYVFNVQRYPFNNTKLRKAFSLAIDRVSIVKNITQGEDQPLLSLVPATAALQQEPYFKDHDVDAARQLFSEALNELGITKEQLPPLTLSYSTLEVYHRVAQAVQQQWYDAFGISVNLENLEWKVYLDKVTQGDFQIARQGWMADFNDAMNFLELFKDKMVGNNWSQWENSEYIEYLNQAEHEANPTARLMWLHKAEQVLMEEMPLAPLYSQGNTYIRNPKLKKVYISPIGMVDFKWAHLEEPYTTNKK
ncbi:MAG: oppA [Chlamydiales bacterium]|jgi:oligopeptide transport system substrate-binding protein|nr:oppA [Chlamydiales bacterium]